METIILSPLLFILIHYIPKSHQSMYCANYRVVKHQDGGETMMAGTTGMCITNMFCLRTTFRDNNGPHDINVQHECAEAASLPQQVMQACNQSRDTLLKMENPHDSGNSLEGPPPSIECCKTGDCCNVNINAQFHCEQAIKARADLHRQTLRLVTNRQTSNLIATTTTGTILLICVITIGLWRTGAHDYVAKLCIVNSATYVLC